VSTVLTFAPEGREPLSAVCVGFQLWPYAEPEFGLLLLRDVEDGSRHTVAGSPIAMTHLAGLIEAAEPPLRKRARRAVERHLAAALATVKVTITSGWPADWVEERSTEWLTTPNS
jgi:hypothetical protein